MPKVAVVAVGGNSLIKDPKRVTVPDQYEATKETCTHIAGMIEQGWDVIVTHGNGPQVGFILRRSEIASHELHEVPLDSCGADTQGAIGYMIQKALYNEFRRRGIAKQAVTVVTQTRVDRADPAFQHPSKPIGSFMDHDAALRKREQEGWEVVEDAGRGWRRVVPSPLPKEIIEREAIKTLIAAGFVVVAVGGGGIPVVADEHGDLTGIAAVIDKDYASSLLASTLGADLLLISTAVEKVYLNYRQPNQVGLDRITVTQAREYLEQGHFAKSSMRPKIEAALSFLEQGGQQALITDPGNIERALRGETGTWIVPG